MIPSLIFYIVSLYNCRDSDDTINDILDMTSVTAIDYESKTELKSTGGTAVKAMVSFVALLFP